MGFLGTHFKGPGSRGTFPTSPPRPASGAISADAARGHVARLAKGLLGLVLWATFKKPWADMPLYWLVHRHPYLWLVHTVRDFHWDCKGIFGWLMEHGSLWLILITTKHHSAEEMDRNETSSLQNLYHLPLYYIVGWQDPYNGLWNNPHITG